jgi:hypothetical protein
MMLCSLLASAQDDITIAVHRPVELNLSPGISVLINDSLYTFTITGMKRGMTAEATLASSKLVVSDTTIIIRPSFRPAIGIGYDTTTMLLRVTIIDSSGQYFELQRKFGVVIRRKKPIPRVSSQIINRPVGIYLNKRFTSGLHAMTLYTPVYDLIGKSISADYDQAIRRSTHLELLYVDSTSRNRYTPYRSIDLTIYASRTETQYHSDDNTISPEMRRAIRAQKGKAAYLFQLHQQFAAGDTSRRDIIDSVRYGSIKKSH